MNRKPYRDHTERLILLVEACESGRTRHYLRTHLKVEYSELLNLLERATKTGLIAISKDSQGKVVYTKTDSAKEFLSAINTFNLVRR